MGSPKTNNKAEEAAIAITSSDTATVQDSPIFSYIGNLSPIKPDKVASVTQGFPGINSPPLVFTSPRINPRQQSLDLKRTQCPLSFSVKLYQPDDKGKNIPTGVDESEKFNSQFSCGLNPRIEKVPASNSSRHDQTGSPTGCVDEYLADLLADCTDSTHSTSSGLEQSDNVSKLLDGSMNAKEPVAKLANKEGEQDFVVAVGASPANFEQDEEENQGSSSSHLKPAEKDGETGGSGVASGQCLEVESNLPFNHAFEHQHSEQPVMEEYEECGETTGAVVPNVPALNIMTHVPKASQNQLGKRRRLQFEEAQHNSIANSPGSWNPSNSPSCSRSPVISDNLEVLKLSCVDIPATPSNSQLGNMTQSKISRNPVMTVSKPSGIGLHLNSIVNSLPLHSVSTTSIKIADRSYSSVKARTEGCKPETHVSASASSASCPYPCSTKPPLKQVENRGTSDLSEKANSEHADIVEEFNQGSPRKKRKKTSETSDGDGCKRCNCKKTKCLKLYCDCFAAGIYCADPCACQGCFNRPEYEDTVLETRQQIESRNPLAFAPKIIQRLTKPPASNSGKDGDRSTPLSGRHKKGCNCKKSMCLKKYCECYQANVGCSDVCRCEGCKNIHGRKGERCIIREVDSAEAIDDQLGYSFDQKREIVATTDSYLLPEFRNPSSLTPLTPSFQFSNHGKDASKSRLLSGRYLPSPESDNTFLPPNTNVLGLPRNSAPHNMLLETRTEILDSGSFDQESDYANVEVVDEFSPRCRKLGNICHLNALTTYSEGPVSIDSPKRRELVNVSRLPYCSGSGRMSSISSCPWSGSPLTPGTPFTNTKLQQMESDNRLYDILEDDTPQILKENPTPCNDVKVSSPNKKRVSPPHSRLSSSSLTGLKSGRKFILQAVPSFPPLTPCIDSKDSFDENKNGPRNSSDKE